MNEKTDRVATDSGQHGSADTGTSAPTETSQQPMEWELPSSSQDCVRRLRSGRIVIGGEARRLLGRRFKDLKRATSNGGANASATPTALVKKRKSDSASPDADAKVSPEVPPACEGEWSTLSLDEEKDQSTHERPPEEHVISLAEKQSINEAMEIPQEKKKEEEILQQDRNLLQGESTLEVKASVVDESPPLLMDTLGQQPSEKAEPTMLVEKQAERPPTENVPTESALAETESMPLQAGHETGTPAMLPSFVPLQPPAAHEEPESLTPGEAQDVSPSRPALSDETNKAEDEIGGESEHMSLDSNDSSASNSSTYSTDTSEEVPSSHGNEEETRASTSQPKEAETGSSGEVLRYSGGGLVYNWPCSLM